MTFRPTFQSWITKRELYDWRSFQDYDIRVFASNQAGECLEPNVVTVSTPRRSPPIFWFIDDVYVESGNAIRLVWYQGRRANQIRLERRLTGTANWTTLLETEDLTITEFLDSGVTPGNYYDYRLIAINESGETPDDWYAPVLAYDIIPYLQEDFDNGPGRHWVRLQGVTPRVVDGRTVLAFDGEGERFAEIIGLPGEYQMVLNFDAIFDESTYSGSGGAPDLQIHTFQNVQWGEWVRITYDYFFDWAELRDLQYPLEDQEPVIQFRIYQDRHGGAGQDVWFLDAFWITGPAIDPPDTPGSLSVGDVTSGAVELNWQVVETAMDYIIERSLGGEFEEIAVMPALETTFIDEAMPAESNATYRLSASNHSGVSNAGSTASAQTISQFRDWQLTHFSDPDSADAALNQVDAFGIPNLLRFALNAPPGSKPRIFVDDADGLDRIEFMRRRTDSNPGVVYELEFSEDLHTWLPAPGQITTEPFNYPFEWAIWTDTDDGENARFYRVTVHEETATASN